jgi:hypothetical protein
MNRSPRTLRTLAAALGAAAALLYVTRVLRPPPIDLGTYAALGAVTAEETARLLGYTGHVLVIARDTGADKNPSVEAELAAFERTLKQHKGLRQITERFQATPLLMMATGGSVPPEHLAEAVQRHPNVGALVLFCGLPPLAEPDLAALRKDQLKIVVVSALRPEYGALLKQQVLALAIAPRPEPPPPDAPPPRTLRERFDQEFVLVTAADAAGWP